MLTFLASCTAIDSRTLARTSPPPSRAATMMAWAHLLQALPRFLSLAALRCLMLAHLEWPAIGVSEISIASGDWPGHGGEDEGKWKKVNGKESAGGGTRPGRA